MGLVLMQEVIDHSLARRGAAYAVHRQLAIRTFDEDKGNRVCRVSIPQLMRETGLSKRSVNYGLQLLRETFEHIVSDQKNSLKGVNVFTLLHLKHTEGDPLRCKTCQHSSAMVAQNRQAVVQLLPNSAASSAMVAPIKEEYKKERPDASTASLRSAASANGDMRSRHADSEKRRNPPSSLRSDTPLARRDVRTPDDPRFEEFWKLYRRKGSRPRTLEAWRLAVEKHGDGVVEEIMAALSKALSSQEWKNEDGKYIPGSERFLKEERWLSTYTPPAKRRLVL